MRFFGLCLTYDVYLLFPELAEHKKQLGVMGLRNNDVARLYKTFKRMDGDGSGSIEFSEMLNYLDIEATPFTKRVFSVIDGDGSGTLDVYEFICAVWEYCTLDQMTLVGFTFDLYDDDWNNTLEVDEIISLCKDVYGKAFGKSKLSQKIVKDVKAFVDSKLQNSNGYQFLPLITKPVFYEFCKTHPMLLFPAFQFQLGLRKGFQGEKFWNKVSRHQQTLSPQQRGAMEAARTISNKKRRLAKRRSVRTKEDIEEIEKSVAFVNARAKLLDIDEEKDNEILAEALLGSEAGQAHIIKAKQEGKMKKKKKGKGKGKAKAAQTRTEERRHLKLRRSSSFDTGHSHIIQQLKKQEQNTTVHGGGGGGGGGDVKKHKKKHKPHANNHNKPNRRPVAKRRHSSSAILPGLVHSPRIRD